MPEDRFIQLASPHLDGNEHKYVQDCLDSTWISSAGRYVGEFEERFAEFCGVEHAIVTNNGTTALHLALVALGIGPGDEVLIPTLTYIATANAVTYCGARPVLVESEPVGMTIDADDARSKVTENTKAIIPVHLYGNAANMTALNEIASEFDLSVVEDAAEAHGARVAGVRVGGLGTAGVFSFFGNKIITTGEGGAVTTNDSELAERLRLLRGQGMDPQRRYWFPIVGYNYRMTNIAAGIGLGQLEGVDSKLAYRQDLADEYRRNLDDANIVLPSRPEWSESVNWLYTVLLAGCTAEMRDEVGRLMAQDQIETRPVFYPMHQLPPYYDADSAFPVADSLAAQGLSLPTHTQLSYRDVARVAARLRHHVGTVRSAA